MKKSIQFLGLFLTGIISLLSYSGVNGAYIANNLTIKHTSDLGVSNGIIASASGDVIDFTMNLIVDASQPNREYQVSLIPLPIGLTATGYTIKSDTCADINSGTGNLIVDSQTDGNFVFRFKPTSTGICSNIVVAHYQTNGITAQDYTISYTLTDSGDGIFGNGNDTATTSNNVQLTILNTVSILKAKTFDVNGDGYLNGYFITFNRPVPATLLSPSQINIKTSAKTASGIIFGAAVGSYTGIITWNDGLFLTNETPTISIVGDMNYTTEDYFVGVVEDTARPKISFNHGTGNYTGSQNIEVNSNESGAIYYSLSGSATNTSPRYTGGITINSDTSLSILANDLAGNMSSTNATYTFMCSGSAPSNGTISSYPSCIIGCNSGYQLSGNTCVLPTTSGGGGGGGGGGSSISIFTKDVCPTGDFSGNFYDTTCGKVSTGSGITSTSTDSTTTSTGSVLEPSLENISIPWIPNGALPSPSGLTGVTQDLIYFRSLSEAQNYLKSKLKNKIPLRLVDIYAKTLFQEDANYFLSLDQNYFNEYNKALNAYVFYLLQQDVWISGNHSISLRNSKKNSLALMKKGALLVKNRDTKYVTSYFRRSQQVNVYRTAIPTYKRTLLRIETKVIPKLYRLNQTNSITETEYLTALSNYNAYVLHFSISARYPKNTEAKKRYLQAYQLMIATYNKPIIKKKVSSTVPTPSNISQKTVGDYYTFTQNLKLGDRNEEVVRLQDILRRYGYFEGISSTGYFGNLTKSSLIRFSKEKLLYTNTSGVFDEATRSRLLQLEWK